MSASDGARANSDSNAFAGVKSNAVAIAAARRVMAMQLIRQGIQLQMARGRLGPDSKSFEAWLATIDLTPAQAERLMQVAERFSDADNADQVDAAAMLLLAGPDVPAPAIHEARYLARRGTHVSLDRARQLIARCSPPRPATACPAAGPDPE